MIRRYIPLLLALLLMAPPLSVIADNETELTLSIPGGGIRFTEDPAADAFALAVGYSLSETCEGLAGYVVTVQWDPAVLSLRTDYREDMTDAEMMSCSGCYFEDLYKDGLTIAPSGSYIVNYREAAKGILTVASVSATNKPDRNAVLFVLDFAPLRDQCLTTVTVSVQDELGLTSASGSITAYQKESSLTFRIGSDSLPGDANGDGKVTEEDKVLIRQYATGELTLSGDAFYKADLNGDGKVNAVDYLLVCRALQELSR